MSISPSSPLKERYNDAKEKLLQIPGVVSVSLGYKETGKDFTDQFGLRVYVQQKMAPADVPANQMIPHEINGLKTDVVEVYETKNLSKGGTRPLVGGIDLSQYHSTDQITLGTLGCVVKRTSTTQHMVISNQHVLEANGTRPAPEDSAAHIARQPKRNDSSGFYYENIVGRIRYGVKTNVTSGTRQFWVDAAVADVDADVERSNRIEDIGTLEGPQDLVHFIDEGLPANYTVRKRGRTTQLTHGVIIELNHTGITLDENNLPLNQENLILIRPVAPFKTKTVTYEVPAAQKETIKKLFAANEPLVTVTEEGGNKLKFVTNTFSQSGDSGSMIVNEGNGKVVGLLFGGTIRNIDIIENGNPARASIDTGRGLACHIQPVQEQMDIVIESGTVGSAGAPIEIEEAAFARAEMAPDLKDAMTIAEADLNELPAGRLFIDLARYHAAELVQLIHHHRPVKVIWHRNKCPAFGVSFINMIRDHNERLHKTIAGITITTATQHMWDALNEHGSPELQHTLQEHGHNILQLLSECNTYNDMIHFLKKEIWTGYTTSTR